MLNDLTGRTFGRLTVESFLHRDGCREPVWHCRCACGKTRTAKAYKLLNGRSTSCGCLTLERISVANKRHGLSRTAEHKCWQGIISRCCVPTDPHYENYGARGIRMCERWRQSFETFMEDMGPRPSPAHSIDRIDNDGHYEPGNCRWATMAEQSLNKRNTRYVTAFGRTQPLSAWAAERGMSKGLISDRLNRGWRPEKAMTAPPMSRKQIGEASRRAAAERVVGMLGGRRV